MATPTINYNEIVGWKEHVRGGDSNVAMRVAYHFLAQEDVLYRCEFFGVDTMALGLLVFFYDGTNITADYMLRIKHNPTLKAHILDVVCD